MEFKPLFDRILVKPVTAEQTVGGLYIPDTSNNLKKGIVESVGDGLPGKPMAVKAGMEVLFDKEDATPVTLEEQQFVILKETQVWMVK